MFDKNVLMDKNKELAKYFSKLLGSDLNAFLKAVSEDRAIRINTLKTEPAKLINSFANNCRLKTLLFTPIGYKILNEKASLSHTLEFFKGHFAFQGASSQIPALALNPKAGERVLDMAASPGSKTTQMGVMMQNQGELIVNDSNLNRMQALNTNTQKTGLINQIIYYLAGERIGRLFPEYFDKVLLDTPCTGLGTLASHPEVLSWWSLNKLEKLTKIQKQLLISAIKAAKVGGEIVYSTCSVAPEENELIINDILNNYPVEVLPIDNPGMDYFDQGCINYKNIKMHPSLKNTKRIWPHKHKMEGFFIARLLKTKAYYNKNNPKETSYSETITCSDPLIHNNLLSLSKDWGIAENVWQNYRYIKTRDRIWMLNNGIKKILNEGFNNAGMLLAEERLNIWKLTHQAIQFFSNKITKRKISLSPAHLKDLFLKGRCKWPVYEKGYYALVIQNEPSAIVYIENNEVKIKLPHPYNLFSIA